MKFIQEYTKEELKENFNTLIDGNFIVRKTNNRKIGFISLRNKYNISLINEKVNDDINSIMLILPNTTNNNIIEIKVNQKEKLYPYNIILANISHSLIKNKNIYPDDLIITIEANDIDIQVDVNRKTDNLEFLNNVLIENNLYKKFLFKDRNSLLLFLFKYHFLNFINQNKEYNFKISNNSYFVKDNSIYLHIQNFEVYKGVMESNIERFIDSDEKKRHLSDLLFIHFSYIEDLIKNNTRLFVNSYLNNVPIFENKEEIYSILKEGE